MPGEMERGGGDAERFVLLETIGERAADGGEASEGGQKDEQDGPDRECHDFTLRGPVDWLRGGILLRMGEGWLWEQGDGSGPV